MRRYRKIFNAFGAFRLLPERQLGADGSDTAVYSFFVQLLFSDEQRGAVAM